MQECTVFSTKDDNEQRHYETNAPRETINQCFDAGITKNQFIERIETLGYTVNHYKGYVVWRLPSDLHYHFKPEGVQTND